MSQAVGNGAEDTIVFAAELGGSIALNSDLPHVDSDGIIIDGDDRITVDGKGERETFVVEGSLILKNLTVANGSSAFGSIIVFENHSLELINCTVTNNHGEASGFGSGIDIKDGATATVDTSTVTGNTGGSAAIQLHGSSTLNLTNSTLSGNEGGISNSGGNLEVINSTIKENAQSGGDGGGIWHFAGSATITDSTISGNTAGSDGAGIQIYEGTVNVINSTISGNGADNQTISGGGISVGDRSSDTASDATSPTVSITNTTVSGNTADFGGGIYVVDASSLTVTNSTINGNGADSGGGILMTSDPDGSPTVTLINSVIANSTSGGDCVNNSGTLQDGGHNLVEDGSCITTGFDGNLDGDPMLGSLADNGGPTQTHDPLDGSPLVDAGDDAECSADPVNNLDQRGVSRPRGSACDIGAVERAFPILDVAVSGEGIVDPNVTPEPVSGWIDDCDAAGLGEPYCTATYSVGDSVTLNMEPAANWHINSVSGCGGEQNGTSYTTAPLFTDCTANVVFAIDQYTVTPSVTSGMGTITPDAAQTVDHGSSIEFTMTAASGWSIDSIDGTCSGTLSGNTYTAGPVTADCTVDANFTQDQDEIFSDRFQETSP